MAAAKHSYGLFQPWGDMLSSGLILRFMIYRALMALLATMVVACTPASFEAEDCDLTLNEVKFSRSLNGAARKSVVTHSTIEITSGANTDYFNAPNGTEKYGNAPVLLTAVDNTRPFTFTTQVTPAFDSTYDAGAVYVFVDDNHWQKFAFELDERQASRIVTVRTVDTSDDNNHEVIAHPTVYLKISSDVESIGYYFSLDGITWQLARVYKNDFPAAAWIGLSAQCPLGTGITATFANMTLRPEAVKDFRQGL